MSANFKENMDIKFLAALNRVTRDSENATKVVFECDCQQLDKINLIPAQCLLKIVVTPIDSETNSIDDNLDFPEIA